MRIRFRPIHVASLGIPVLLLAGCGAYWASLQDGMGSDATPPAWRTEGRYADRTEVWGAESTVVLDGFLNMYNFHIVHTPGDIVYPYKAWFFGWRDEICNPGYPGCDATVFARATKVAGPWEVYCGEDAGGNPVWRTDSTPAEWYPVISGGTTIFDNWHNGDPSVVYRDGVYYMAYSATGHNADGIPFGQPGDTDSDISCVMGATSTDGIHWTKTDYPILVDPENIGQAPVAPGEYLHPQGLYHRPSLMWEEGKWRLWFDAWNPDRGGFGMCYAENTGDFTNHQDWVILRDDSNFCIENFPNPDVVRMGDVLVAYADPGGYPGEGWATRRTAMAVSLDGLDWVMLGALAHDADVQANQVPELYVEPLGDGSYRAWLFTGGQVLGGYYYDNIRFKTRVITERELDYYERVARDADGTYTWEPAP